MSREYTESLLEMIENGLVDRDTVITAALKFMSEDDVRDMMEANEMLLDDEEEWSPDTCDFNDPGSRHHY